MDRLFAFLSLLTAGMHEACPRSKVIWYDSVTVDGNLKWQNSLNKMNQYVFKSVMQSSLVIYLDHSLMYVMEYFSTTGGRHLCFMPVGF